MTRMSLRRAVERTVERILDAFEVGEPPRAAAPPGLSAVLIVLYETTDGPALLYTRRAETLRSHPGEISFPGGRVDATDTGPREAALREAREEVGVTAADLERVAHFVDYLTFR